MASTTREDILTQIRHEITKTHTEFDGSDRPSKIYVAPVYAEQDTPCFVVEFIYHTGLNIVKGRKEGLGLWQSSFEDPYMLVDDLGNQLIDDLGNDLLGLGA